MQAIVDLPNTSEDSASSLRSFHDGVLRHMRALKVLKEPTSSWDTPMICLLTAKLDKESRREWEKAANGTQMPKFDKFLDFLRERCQLLEAIHAGCGEKKQNTRPSNKVQSINEKKSIGKSFVASQSTFSCFNCKENHVLNNCSEFLKLSIDERKEFVKKKGLCYNCLRKNHFISECKSGNCMKCHKRHHTLLHKDNLDSNSEYKNQASTSVEYVDQGNKLSSNHISSASSVMLSTAIVDMYDSEGKKHECRVLLDSGSQPNIMTVKFAKLLKLKTRKTNASIEVINNQEINSLEWVYAKFQSKHNNYSANLSFLVLPRITSDHPNCPVNKEILNIPKNIPLADSRFDRPSEIDALISAKIFYDLLCSERIPLAFPRTHLQNTRIGWIVTGKINCIPRRNQVSCNLIRDQLHKQMERFWEIEELSDQRILSREEEACEQHFRDNYQRIPSGQFMVRLPAKEGINQLGSSHETARRQFFALERRLEKNATLRDKYNQFMREYLDLNHMEEVSSNEKDGYFIPHHAILKENSLTTKLRAVFNASAKSSSGVSLNEMLMVGPTIQDGVLELILRFRLFEIAIGADIEKMYRQFLVHPEDRKYQKIFWRFDPNQPLKIYQLRTVTYGTSAAPFLATRCLAQLAEEESSLFPEAAAVLRNDFYVDDAMTGADSYKKAERLIQDLIEVTSKAGLRLCKWVSNDSRLTESMPDSLLNMRKKLDDHQTITKTLGIVWDAATDELGFEVELKQESEIITKRSILSETAQFYDPQGWIAPVIVLAKIQMQELWKLKIGWDDPVPEEMDKNWRIFRDQLKVINTWTLPRLAKIPNAQELQLHGFADASQRAYGACIYLRSSSGGKHHSMLMCSKSRVAPVQIISLPRLELCAAVLLTKLFKTVIKALKIEFKTVTFWSDSTIVLNWINKPPYKLETFEANRITEIQSVTRAGDWRHVSTTENPADVLSRGQLPSDFLTNQLWKHGPAWLRENEEAWPPRFQSTQEGQEESKKIQVLTAKVTERWSLLSKYSSMRILIRVTAYCLRFYRNAREKGKRRRRSTGPLSVDELKSAEIKLIIMIQREEFPNEIRDLSRGKVIHQRSKIARLSPVMEDGILRVGGRIQQSELENDQIHPILIPKSHPVTTLLIRNAHWNLKHAGVNATLYNLRQKFWIVDGRSAVGKVVTSCVTCCKVKPKEIAYVMGNLPKVRVSAARPFENVGIDYCGYFFVKEKRHRNRAKLKVYAAVFVCLATKAVHIELVENLTTEAFIGSLRRFFARRGKSRALYSDNGTNFVGANNELRDLYNFLESEKVNEKIQRELSDQLIEWNFIPPRTPHFGGIWEAAVKVLKHHLRRVVGDALLTYEQLNTLMVEIEALMNSRPLTPMSSDPNDLSVLTPGHFLIGQSLLTIPTTDLSQIPVNRLSVWQHIQKIKGDLWKRWSKEYLTELNVKNKWFMGQDNIKVGTLVTIRDDNLPPMRWCMGRIIEVISGDDSVVRVVKLKTANGIVERGVKRIAPLPIEV
ncbi:uncharacterized protein LOC127288678 [Leptopilina boulardi]|uniref:uncharacterized protein LOC127288678 n=1 Tax=Leptopilina boulardi TaxID=63433 RepID=UPI0021F58DD0|nr:uncharacterized protein LOC127288678 [Leptopilina boulardi]